MWKEDLLYWGPCVRLLEIWQLGLANMYVYLMYVFEMAEREICFERRESKQSPSPVGLWLTSCSRRVGLASVFTASGCALSWHTHSMREWRGSWESYIATSLLKINSGILMRAA